MRKSIALILALCMVACMSLTAFAGDEGYDSIMGDPRNDPDFALAAACGDGYYTAGKTVNVVISVKDIKPADGLPLISLKLYYDKQKVSPVIVNNADSENAEMNAFLTKKPSDNWEVIARLFETEGYYCINALTETDKTAKADSDIVITVPFKVAADATGIIAFQIPHNGVESVTYSLDTLLYGNGDAVAIDLRVDTTELVSGAEEKVALNKDEEENYTLFPKAAGMKVGELIGCFKGSATVFDSKGNEKSESSVLCTGDMIHVGGKVIPVVVMGDINGDGKISAADYLLIKRIVLKMHTAEGAYFKAALVSGKTAPKPADYLLIKRQVLKLNDFYKTLFPDAD